MEKSRKGGESGRRKSTKSWWRCKCLSPEMEQNSEFEEKSTKNNNNSPVLSVGSASTSPCHHADSYSGMNAEEREETLKAAIKHCNRSCSRSEGD